MHLLQSLLPQKISLERQSYQVTIQSSASARTSIYERSEAQWAIEDCIVSLIVELIELDKLVEQLN